MTLTDAQKAARTSRCHDILQRINGSGEAANPDDAIGLAKAIEKFEFGDGTGADGARRKALTMPLLGSGTTKMADVVAAAQAQLDAFGKFD